MARLLHGISHWWIMPIIQPVEVTPKIMEMTARMFIRAIFVRSHLPSALFTASSVRRGPQA